MFKNLLAVVCTGVAVSCTAATLQERISSRCKVSCVSADRLLKSVETEAFKRGLDFKLVLAVIEVESGYQHTAVSRGNHGLMQVNLKYHRRKFVMSPTHVEDNVKVGVSILSDCLAMKKGHVPKALKCYNGSQSDTYRLKVEKVLSSINRVVFTNKETYGND